MKTTTSKEEQLVRLTTWVSKKNLKFLMKKKGEKYTQSEILRRLLDDEAERIKSWEVHKKLYGILKPEDFDDRFL